MSFNLVAQGVAFVLRTLARLTGRGFLERLSEFVGELNQLFGGFRERAERVAAAFRRPEFAYLLAATAAPGALDEAAFFAERLNALGLRASGLIVNRVRTASGRKPELAALVRELELRGLPTSTELAQRILTAQAEELALGALDRETLEARKRTQFGTDRVPWVMEVPAFADVVHDVAALLAVGRALGLTRDGASSDSAP
jgi:hypothetical protein